MAFPTTNMWFRNVTVHFLTVGRDLNPPLKECGERSCYDPMQLEKFAGVCP